MFAGIYVQVPQYGLFDKSGRIIRQIEEEIDPTDTTTPNDAYTRCLSKLFQRCPEIEEIEHQAPKYKKLLIKRSMTYEEITESLANS